jgi:hypothetical protein
MKDPICGNCKEPKSKHLREPGRDELFCFTDTTGDIFTDVPWDCDLFQILEEQQPGIMERLEKEWQKRNGHEVAE